MPLLHYGSVQVEQKQRDLHVEVLDPAWDDGQPHLHDDHVAERKLDPSDPGHVAAHPADPGHAAAHPAERCADSLDYDTEHC